MVEVVDVPTTEESIITSLMTATQSQLQISYKHRRLSTNGRKYILDGQLVDSWVKRKNFISFLATELYTQGPVSLDQFPPTVTTTRASSSPLVLYKISLLTHVISDPLH